MKTILKLLLIPSLAASGQVKSNDRIDSTTRSLPSPVVDSVQKKSSSKTTAKSSDTGAQRPLVLKKSGFSATFGYDSDISYKQNPLGAPGVLDQQADAVWVNKFHGMAKLGVYDLDSSVLTPFVGGAWSMTDYTYQNSNELVSDLSVLNHNTTIAYLLFLLQHESGWSFRSGVMYSNDRSTENDTEEYMEFFPSVGATKAYSLLDDLLGVFDASIGYHYGEIAVLADGHTKDELDHMDATLSYSLIYSLDNFSITPNYSFSYRKYDNGINLNRSDILHNLGLKVSYPLSESFELALHSNYAKRLSDGKDTDNLDYSIYNDFKKFDIGAGLSLTASF